MAQICTAHPEYMQVELDFRAEKDEKKKVAATSAMSTSRGEASPSVINVESSHEAMDNAFWEKISQYSDDEYWEFSDFD
jgi:hypothetical protein